MKKIFLSILSAVIVSAASTVHAQDAKYVLEKKIALPGEGGYDYLSIDKVNNRLYVSHGTAVNVVDLASDKVVGTIDGMQGVHGIAIVNKVNKGFISDGKGNAAVAFDLKTLAKVATIPLSNKGADAIIYDAFSDKVFVFNGDASNSSVVDPNNLEDKNSLDVIDTKTLKVLKNYSLAPCGGPTGIAMDEKNQRLFTVCRENKGMSVVDATNGKVIVTIPIGAGVDAVVYDPETKLIFVSNGDATTTIIKQLSANEYKTVQTLVTQTRAKTLALDTKTHKIYLSCAEFENGTRKVVPGTFAVLVYKMQ
jgi:DNA-binding beta-propeller fold protein YncE